MAQNKGKPDNRSKKDKRNGKGAADVFIAWAKPFERLADKFGPSIAFLFFVLVFVVMYASADQKKEIIDQYILWHSTFSPWPLLTFGAANLVLFGSQRIYYKRQLNMKQQEVDRLAAWKTAHQSSGITQPTHSTKAKGASG